MNKYLDEIVVLVLLAVMFYCHITGEQPRGEIVAYSNASREIYKPADMKIEGCTFVNTTASMSPNSTHTATYQPENATLQDDVTYYLRTLPKVQAFETKQNPYIIRRGR